VLTTHTTQPVYAQDTLLPNSTVQTKVRRSIDEKTYELSQRFVENDDKWQWFLQRISDKLNEIHPDVREQNKRIVEYYITSLQRRLDEIVELERQALAVEAHGFATKLDMQSIQTTRLDRLNTERLAYNRPQVVLDETLNFTAQERATTLATRNEWVASPNVYKVHLRNPWDWFYNFDAIWRWFASYGVTPDKRSWVLYSEWVWYEYMRCPETWDCTQTVINEIKQTRDFFMAEKPYNGVHYRAMMQRWYKKIWVWVAYDGKRYRLVIHYTT